MIRFIRLFTASALVLALAGGAAAETKVGGDVDIDVRTGHVTTVGIGKDVLAYSSVGTIHDGTKVGGDVDLQVRTGHVTTVGIGKDVRACSMIGSVGASTDCE